MSLFRDDTLDNPFALIIGVIRFTFTQYVDEINSKDERQAQPLRHCDRF